MTMIAVLDTTRDGWALVGKLHRAGYAVSWLVGETVDAGFDALPVEFAGVVHRVGFGDEAQVATAVRGCAEVVVLAGGEEGERALRLAGEVVAAGVPLYRAVRDGGAFEIEEIGGRRREGTARRVKLEPMLAGHVG